ncbi:MAG: hypothetical protein ACYTFI_18775 [Planctomycetota bacterium]
MPRRFLPSRSRTRSSSESGAHPIMKTVSGKETMPFSADATAASFFGFPAGSFAILQGLHAP